MSHFAAQIHLVSYQQYPERPADAVLLVCTCMSVSEQQTYEGKFVSLKRLRNTTFANIEEYVQLIQECKSHCKSMMNTTKENNLGFKSSIII